MDLVVEECTIVPISLQGQSLEVLAHRDVEGLKPMFRDGHRGHLESQWACQWACRQEDASEHVHSHKAHVHLDGITAIVLQCPVPTCSRHAALQSKLVESHVGRAHRHGLPLGPGWVVRIRGRVMRSYTCVSGKGVVLRMTLIGFQYTAIHNYNRPGGYVLYNVLDLFSVTG